jgi:hypothetical protein
MDKEKRRNEFIRVYGMRRATLDDSHRVIERSRELIQETTALLVPIYRERFPRRRKMDSKRIKAALPDLWESAGLGLGRGFQHRYIELQERVNQLDKELEKIRVAPKPGNKRLSYRMIYPRFSQGFGQDHYDKKDAELHKMRAEMCGLKAEISVERCLSRSAWHSSYNVYEVWVWVDSNIDVEILRRTSPMSLRETVKWAWGNGVNPRVFWPMLPCGYEEKNGLDYFGGEVKS